MKTRSGEIIRVIKHHVMLVVGNAEEEMVLRISGQPDGPFCARMIEHKLPTGRLCSQNTEHLICLDTDLFRVIESTVDEHLKICPHGTRKNHLHLVKD